MSCRGDVGRLFSKDAPRPPVPGEEGRGGGVCRSKAESDWPSVVHRSGAALGLEPEGSALQDGLLEPWAETLLSLLEDRDGTALFLRFLQPLGCAPLLEFWFACSGFQKAPRDVPENRLRLARAMYRCYLSEGVVSRRISPEIRCGIRDGIQQLRLDSGLFAQAHAQVQAVLQDSLFPLFLRSDVYLKHTQTIEPSPGTRLPGKQAMPSQGEEPDQETLPPHNAANQKRAGDQDCRQRRHACHRHHRTQERNTRHTHLPHTPVKMTPHTFAAELMRRLQELQTQTQTQSPSALRHTVEETNTSRTTASSSCHLLTMLDSDCVTQRDISTQPDTCDVNVKSIVKSPAHIHHFCLLKMLTDGLEWCGLLVDYHDVFISCLDSHSDGSHSLQRWSDSFLQISWCVGVCLQVCDGGVLLWWRADPISDMCSGCLHCDSGSLQVSADAQRAIQVFLQESEH